MRRLSGFVLLLILSLILVAGFQNCSNVRLAPKIVHSFSSASTSGSICSLPALSSTDKVKFTFVVDMSASNATIARTSPPEVVGSDLTRQRLAVIRDFLSKDCLKANDSTRVAVIGFAHQKIIQPGTSCNRNQYKPVNDYLDAGTSDPIDFLEQEHDAIKADCQAGGGRCSEYTTRYDEGLECAKQIETDDIALGNPDGKKAFYMTFFLTDGEPTVPGVPSYDVTDSTYITMKNTVLQKIRDMRNAAEDDALGMTLRPIFYGGEYLKRKDPSGRKERIARDILTDMAREGLTEYIYLQDVGQINFCDFLVSGTRVPYRLKQLVATNLTVTKRGREFLPDSDMDGLPDRDEAGRGFDPTRARSIEGSELLDGFCGGLLAGQCFNSAHADCGPPNALGLTRCEIEKWGLTNGLDSDSDDFVDIMEVIKGAAPNVPSSYVDGDSASEFDEMMIGRDPKFPDDDVLGEWLMRYRRWPLSTPLPGCPADQESYQYSLDQIPLVSTLETNSDDPVSRNLPWMHHGPDINVILVYYVLTPANQAMRQELNDQVYFKYIKIHLKGQKTFESRFFKAGELTDGFAPYEEGWQ